MNPSELQETFIDYVKDQPILHPCFRFADVKRALSHIEYNLGLIPQPNPDIASTFFYQLKEDRVAIMVTPVRFDEERMSYAFRALFHKGPAPVKKPFSDSVIAQTPWSILPVHIYTQLLKKVDFKDVKPLIESFSAKGLLPEHSSYLEPLESQSSTDLEYSWEDAELLLTLEKNGFKTPSYSEFASLLFWGIQASFIKQLAMYGYNHFSLDELEVVWRNKIPLKYLKGFADAGYGFYSADEYHTLYASQIHPNTVAILSREGLTMLTCAELIRTIRYGTGRLLLRA